MQSILMDLTQSLPCMSAVIHSFAPLECLCWVDTTFPMHELDINTVAYRFLTMWHDVCI
jgi:hypothetical protein